MWKECLDQLSQVVHKHIYHVVRIYMFPSDTSNGNFTVRASISISKIRAKFTWNINKLHCSVVKMFTVNNINYHLINRLWAVSLPKRAMSHSKY